MKRKLPISKLGFVKFSVKVILVLFLMALTYSFAEDYQLQSPVLLKFQLPWKQRVLPKVISPISLNDQSYANEAGESAKIKPEEVDIFNPHSVRSYVNQEAVQEWGHKETESLLNLLDGESSFNPIAKNPHSTAFGLFQFLDATWGNYGCKKTVDLKEQVECGFKYISQRYGTPTKAYHFWISQSPNWY